LSRDKVTPRSYQASVQEGSSFVPTRRANDAWIKVKFSPRQEFVIGGYQSDATNFESMLVGYYDKWLYFAGKVRAGLTPHMRAGILPAGCAAIKEPSSQPAGTELPISTCVWRTANS